jgi:hypothetical protein
MKSWISIFLLTFLCSTVFAKKKEPTENLFLITGKVLEISLTGAEPKDCGNVQIVVYQDQEIFVAFYSDAKGGYEFNLPVGFTYEIWFGGSTYVNKKVSIDTRDLPKSKGGYEVEWDLGLFRPYDKVDFVPLKEPFVKVQYSDEYGTLAADMEYTALRSKELDKVIKKAKKSGYIK